MSIKGLMYKTIWRALFLQVRRSSKYSGWNLEVVTEHLTTIPWRSTPKDAKKREVKLKHERQTQDSGGLQGKKKLSTPAGPIWPCNSNRNGKRTLACSLCNELHCVIGSGSALIKRIFYSLSFRSWDRDIISMYIQFSKSI